MTTEAKPIEMLAIAGADYMHGVGELKNKLGLLETARKNLADKEKEVAEQKAKLQDLEAKMRSLSKEMWG